jgi:hypothetical protein
MRTLKDTAYRAYVPEGQGQRRFSMYTTAPSGMVQPTVSHSPPPWDGSAEGYGPPGWDYGVFYRGQGVEGCAGCGVGATNPWFDDETAGFTMKKALMVVGGAALLLYLLRKKR